MVRFRIVSLIGLMARWRLSLREVTRQRSRTGAALAAIAFGVIALLIAGGFIGWILTEMRELTIRTHYGHLQVAREDFWERGSSDPYGFLVRKTPTTIEQLGKSASTVTVAPRLGFAGLASHGDTTVSFIADGVDPASEARFGRALIFMPGRGENLAPGDTSGVVIGQGLAANLGVRTGDTIVLLANTPGGGVNAVEVTIRGVFLTANKGFDDSALRVPLALAHRLLRTTGVQSWTVLLADSRDTERMLAELKPTAQAEGLELRPWTALADTYLRTETLFAQQLGLMGLVLGLLIVLGISNTLTMAVMERTSEIGTSMALGATRRRVLAQFMIEGSLLGVLGGAIGVVLGLALAALLSWIGIPLPPPPGLDTPIIAEIRVSPALALGAFAMAVASTVFASMYPAYRASRMVIVDALRQARA